MLLQAARMHWCLVFPSGILIKGVSTYIRFRRGNGVKESTFYEPATGQPSCCPVAGFYCAGVDVATGVACFVPLLLPPRSRSSSVGSAEKRFAWRSTCV